MRIRRGRSLAGTRVVQTVTALRSKNISVCCVMNIDSILKYSAQNRAYNNDGYLVFSEEFIRELGNRNIEMATIIMDYVPFHRSTVISNVITSTGHRVEYLPPYSPFLNPIENLFSQWKQCVRSLNLESEEQILSYIENSSFLILSTHCRNYFIHMLSFMARCIQREPVIDE
ncbi:hypothetical protein ENBRE01_2629 [Enteropsectra breve]|nr:hypothetical protein ENBRE01_2629 [Enteropsectra breve]